MSDLIWLSETQMRRIEPYFHLSRGVPRVGDQRDHLRDQKRAALARCNQGVRTAQDDLQLLLRWSRPGVFNKIFAGLAAKGGERDQLMIDATHLNAHRTAASLFKKGLFPDVSGAPRAA